jgi:uncharacterized membrane protein affecting hemolysin expression
MKTKFKLIITSILMLVSIVMPAKLKADINTHDAPRSITTAAQQEIIESRLIEINAMDKSNLTRSEKKELKKEVNAIQKEMKTLGNGIYISAGAAIIIIILLIILL